MRLISSYHHDLLQGIIALWSLTASASLESTVRSDAIEAIADAIAAHSTCAKICEHGLGALSALATSKSDVKDFENVIDLIFSCMRINTNNAMIQQVCRHFQFYAILPTPIRIKGGRDPA